MMNWMLAAILTISSASVVSSCSNEDTPAWEGKNVCTNYTVEYNFVHPATNSKYFVTKWAVWSLDNKREPVPVYSQTVSGGLSPYPPRCGPTPAGCSLHPGRRP